MKVQLIAAVTADGFIAKHAEHTADWTSPEDKRFFVALTKESGVMIMGRTTFDTIGRALPGRKTIVYTHDVTAYQGIPGVEATSENPSALIDRLEDTGIPSVVICGGATIYTLFINSGLVTDIFLTIEPILFGSGITLFDDAVNATLELTETRRLNDNTLLVHYAVRSK